MKIISRYLIKTVANSTISTLLVLLALQFVFALVEEVGDFGQGSYGFLKALYVICLTLPHVAYEMLPMALLMGTLLGLGQLATSSELVALRAAGVSIARITRSVMQLGVVLLAVTFVIGEVVVPKTDSYAQRVKSIAMNDDIAIGDKKTTWLRAQPYYLHIDEVLYGGYLRGVEVFELDGNQQLKQLFSAEEVVVSSSGWELQAVKHTAFVDGEAIASEFESLNLPIKLDEDVLGHSVKDPAQLSLFKLPSYIEYFRSNGLETGKYELAFWLKIFAPLSNLVMVLLAVPFAFGSLRSAGNGQRMVVGVFIGLGYALIGRMINHLGLAYDVPPFICAVTPFLLFFSIALFNLRRVR